jgi:hypothetical protein
MYKGSLITDLIATVDRDLESARASQDASTSESPAERREGDSGISITAQTVPAIV